MANASNISTSRNSFLDCLHGIKARIKDSSVKVELTKFDGINYSVWEYQMKQYLSTVGYWGIVCGAITRPVVFPLAVTSFVELA